MNIKGITDEDFVNYKLPSMFIGAATCTFKCDRECGRPVCQNSELAAAPAIDMSDDKIIRRYLKNPITKAIVFGGLEPFDQAVELHEFVAKLRKKYHCDDTVVIYTGYTPDEITMELMAFATLGNIVVKFGRYIPGQEPHYDEVLGVNLASDNQYAKEIC